jgi:hypothetical protein
MKLVKIVNRSFEDASEFRYFGMTQNKMALKQKLRTLN